MRKTNGNRLACRINYAHGIPHRVPINGRFRDAVIFYKIKVVRCGDLDQRLIIGLAVSAQISADTGVICVIFQYLTHDIFRVGAVPVMVLKKHYTSVRVVLGTACSCKANGPCGLIEHVELHWLIVAHSKRTAAAGLIHRLQLCAVRSEQVRQRLHQIVDDLVDFFICILAVVAGRFCDNIEWIFAPIRSFGRIQNGRGMICW